MERLMDDKHARDTQEALLARRTNVLGVGVSSLNMERAVHTLIHARRKKICGYVCVTGVHGVIESQRSSELKQIHNNSFLTVPDGMPTVWMGREQGFTRMGRVYGPDLMLAVFEKTLALGVGHEVLGKEGREPGTENSGPLTDDRGRMTEAGDARKENSTFLYPSQDETGVLDVGEALGTGRLTLEGDTGDVECPMPNAQCLKPMTHFLYGATEEMLAQLKANLEKRFQGVQIVGTYAPPFRPLNDAEERELCELMSKKKPDFFWVGLSTPKQECFMAAHADNPDFGIMLGVGAAFPIHAGLQKDAPEWVKNSGLQWFYRLCQDPKRLWRRYFDIVPKFIGLASLQILGIKKYSIEVGGAGR
jgi:exopolysaccharide biosynthesis WecB/TagA/CpsF family protein